MKSRLGNRYKGNNRKEGKSRMVRKQRIGNKVIYHNNRTINSKIRKEIPVMSVVYDQLQRECYQILHHDKEDHFYNTFEGHVFHENRAGIRYASESEKKGYVSVPEQLKVIYPIDGILGAMLLARRLPSKTTAAIYALVAQLKDGVRGSTKRV